jgi:hypothetical protein
MPPLKHKGGSKGRARRGSGRGTASTQVSSSSSSMQQQSAEHMMYETRTQYDDIAAASAFCAHGQAITGAPSHV